MAAATAVVSRPSLTNISDVFLNIFQVTATLDPDNVTNGATGTATDTVAVPGVALGDVVLGFSLSVDQAGVSRVAYVSAANTVTIVAQNLTGGAVNAASGTVRLLIGRLAPNL
jgi:hypothetical protein